MMRVEQIFLNYKIITGQNLNNGGPMQLMNISEMYASINYRFAEKKVLMRNKYFYENKPDVSGKVVSMRSMHKSTTLQKTSTKCLSHKLTKGALNVE